MAKNKVFWGIVTAAAIGAVIGVLFTTEEGSKARKKLKKKTNSLASELIDALEKSKANAIETAEHFKNKGQKYKNDLAEKADDYIEEVEKEIGKV